MTWTRWARARVAWAGGCRRCKGGHIVLEGVCVCPHSCDTATQLVTRAASSVCAVSARPATQAMMHEA